MKFNLLYTVFLMLSFSLYACSGHSVNANKERGKDSPERGNTIIIINFKKNSDRYFTKFGQLNPMYFEPIIILPPQHELDTSNKLKTIIKLNLTAPNFLALGYSVFYVEPGDSVNINYQTLLSTKYDFKDSVTVNSGQVFFINRNGGDKYIKAKDFLNHFYKIAGSIKSADQMTEYLSSKNINEAIDKYTKLTFNDHPNLGQSHLAFEKVKTITTNDFYLRLLYRLKYLHKNTKDELLKKSIQEFVTRILNDVCAQTNVNIDAFSLGKYLAIYNFFKALDFNENTIQEKFKRCNDTIKQYILLNCLKDGLLASRKDEKEVMDKFTYPLFREHAVKIYKAVNRGVEKEGFINNTIRNVEIFDVKDNKVLFGDLFKSTMQPYIIIDFCGSWCKPCIDEISLYKQTKNLDKSKKIRPIWLFFENDKTKWLNIVKENNLKAENCFVILGNDSKVISKEFALLFDWQGEFPHHFVFSTDGKIVQKNASSLSAFLESELPSSVSLDGGNLSTPALPAKIK